MSNRVVSALACVAVLAAAVVAVRAQDPGDSFDHPAGNVNELTLAGLRPGRSTIAQAEALYGKDWSHPSRDEHDVFIWCNARKHLRLTLEARPDGLIRVVTIATMWRQLGGARSASGRTLPGIEARTPSDQRERPGQKVASHPPAQPLSACSAALPGRAARTGRGVQLGDSPRQLTHVYGKPFFTGPSSWNGHDVNMIVFNFSWAGASKPQILESSFAAGKLVKMTLSAEYY